MSGQLNVGSTSLHGIYIHIAPQGRIILHHRTRYKILSGRFEHYVYICAYLEAISRGGTGRFHHLFVFVCN